MNSCVEIFLIIIFKIHLFELAGSSEDGALSHFLEELFGEVGVSLGLLENLNDLLE